MASDIVAEFVRSERARIAELWETEVRREHAARPVLLDHVDEFLSGLADWIDGHTARAARAFAGLIEGPALQRLGYAVGLETLTHEYGKLRLVLARELIVLPPTAAVGESLLRLHEGMDRAIGDALRRYAAQRDHVRERFISILGHDLRDPLSTVSISAATLAGDPGLLPEHRLVVARILRACQRMQRMIGEVLDFARGHLGGGIPANPTPNDMGEMCRAAADELAVANPDRPIDVETSGMLRGVFDRDRVIQALTNLIGNAVRHGEGPIRVTARESGDRHAIITTVTNRGRPIPEDVLRRIFDPFAAGYSTEPRTGLGLGLYIVQQIALAHGATCEVHSTPEATTFTVRWPRPSAVERRAVG